MELSNDIKETVKDMAKLVLVSGKLSDVHVKNMQMYPLIFFNAVKEAKIEYDLSHKADALVDKHNDLTIKTPYRNNVVTYYLSLDEKSQDNLDKRFSALEASIRTLFWNDIAIEVFFNDRIVYKSRKP